MRRSVRLLLSGLLFSVFSLVGSVGVASQEVLTCEALISRAKARPAKVAPTLIESARIAAVTAIEQARKSAEEAGIIMAGFTNPRQDVAASKTWKGIKAPELIDAMLVPGTTLINFQTKGANEDGVVKLNTGNMVHARFGEGEDQTTIGFNANVLLENLVRQKKSYVRSNSKGVVIFIHGGGTNTTGHHVAAQFLDYINSRGIDVISLDLPWHAMGARNTRSSIIKELQRIEEIVKLVVGDAKVPIILGGHSMGGVVADQFRRLLPESQTFAGFLPLSTVADPFPGGSAADKLHMEEKIGLANLTNENVAAEERNLPEKLMRQRKISALCGAYCDLMMLDLDWRLPDHRGDGYKPALYIIGEGDALYQGYQKSFAEGVASLKNTELVVYGKSEDIKTGEQVTIGHLIFDHVVSVRFSRNVPEAVRNKVNGRKISEEDFQKLRASGDVILGNRSDKKDDLQFGLDDIGRPETFVRMKNFIGKIAGQDLKPSEIPQPTLLRNVSYAYLNNLAFRVFTKAYRVFNVRPTAKGKPLSAEYDQLNDIISALEKKKRNNQAWTPEQTATYPSILARRDALKSIVVDRKGEVDEKDIPLYNQLEGEIRAFSASAAAVTRGEMTTGQRDHRNQPETRSNLDLKKAYELAKQTFLGKKKEVGAISDFLSSQALDRARARREAVYRQMVAQDTRVREVSRGYITAKHKLGDLGPDIIRNFPEAALAEFEKYSRMDLQYGKLDTAFNEVLLEEGHKGRLRFNGKIEEGKTREEVEADANNVVEAFYQTREELRVIKKNLDSRARMIEYFQNLEYQAQVKQYSLVKGNYFSFETYTLADVIGPQFLESVLNDRSLLTVGKEQSQSVKNLETLLRKGWQEWEKVWSARVISIVEDGGLY